MPVNFISNMELAMENLHKRGAFLTVKQGDKINTMTISWGDIGYRWSRPLLTVMVRKSRYTHELIDNNSEFTVSIPLDDSLRKALAICGTKSGRDIDKFKESGISIKASKSLETPVITECELHYECKIVYKQDMDPSMMKEDVLMGSYANGDYHTFYYGEIVNCYLEKYNV
jgi:flavin reductase (DIM6/NTAB) family NADH-FMN oxidoreductase RutF